jgi:hypothetical protein
LRGLGGDHRHRLCLQARRLGCGFAHVRRISAGPPVYEPGGAQTALIQTSAATVLLTRRRALQRHRSIASFRRHDRFGLTGNIRLCIVDIMTIWKVDSYQSTTLQREGVIAREHPWS